VKVRHSVSITAVFLAALFLPFSLPAEEAAPIPCGDPAKPCPGFKVHDLSFPLPKDGKARPDAVSVPFWAVILMSAEKCTITEERRKQVQALFPRTKVFSNRFQCDDDVENNVKYSNAGDLAFLAVYAGQDKAAADDMLKEARSRGRFSGANARRMQVVFVYP